MIDISDNQKQKAFSNFSYVHIPLCRPHLYSRCLCCNNIWNHLLLRKRGQGNGQSEWECHGCRGCYLGHKWGTRINIPAGDSLFVERLNLRWRHYLWCWRSVIPQGAPIRFVWADASGSGPGNCRAPLNNPDPSCGSGIWLDYTVDVQKTKLDYVTLEGTYGIPVQVQNGVYRYGTWF